MANVIPSCRRSQLVAQIEGPGKTMLESNYVLPSREERAAAQAHTSAAITYRSRYSSEPGETGSDFCAYERCSRGGFTIGLGSVLSPGAGSKRNAHAARRAFRMGALGREQPSVIIDEVERAIRVNEQDGSSTSLFVGAFRSDNGILTYAGTGGGGALVFRDAGRHEHLDFARTSSESRKRPSRVQRTVTLPPGSLLVAYTSGLAQARSNADSGMLGSGGVARIVHRVLRASAAPACSTLWREIDRFTGGAYRFDATLILVVALES